VIREEGSFDYDGGFIRLQSKRTLIHILIVNDILDSSRSFHIGDGGDLLGICFDVAMDDDEAK
jgi:hypothetical protein